MSMPGFAADRSLYNTGRGHRSKAAGVSSLGESTVISQGRCKRIRSATQLVLDR